MKRSNLKNIANKSGKIEDKKRYKIQRNVDTKLNKKLNKAYFKEKLPKGKDIKDFGIFCKSYFTNKGVCNDEKIILVEKEAVLRKDSKISDTFNNYFVDITDKSGIYKWGNIPQQWGNIPQQVNLGTPRARSASVEKSARGAVSPPADTGQSPVSGRRAKPPENFHDLLVKITFLKLNMSFYET